jgi:hypothetical protein
VECYLKLSVEGFPPPLEDVIRFACTAPKIPGKQVMTELTFVHNHIIKYVFDKGLSGELCNDAPNDPNSRECGITISSEIKTHMLASRLLKDVPARHGELPDTIAFPK